MVSESKLGTRREILQAALATGVMASVPAAVRSQVAGETVITRPIPSTGEPIPVIGLGTNQFGRTDYSNVRNVLARMHAMGGRAVEADRARSGLAADHVRRDPFAIGHVIHLHLFVFDEIRGPHQQFVNRDAAVVMQVGVGHRRPVNLGFQQGAFHGTSIIDEPDGT